MFPSQLFLILVNSLLNLFHGFIYTILAKLESTRSATMLSLLALLPLLTDRNIFNSGQSYNDDDPIFKNLLNKGAYEILNVQKIR
jgi:hypothetical protein